MEKIGIVLRIPNGDLPTGSDPAAFKDELTTGLKQLAKTYPGMTIDKPIEKPAPAGRAGVYESIDWIIRHHAEIHDALMLLKDLIATTSAAALAYMKLSHEARKSKDKTPTGATITLTVGKSSLALPSGDQEKATFLSAAEQELKKKNN